MRMTRAKSKIEGLQCTAIKVDLLNKKTLESLKLALSSHKGSIPIYLYFKTPEDKRVALAMGKDFNVQPSIELIDELEELLGEGTVSVQSTETSENSKTRLRYYN